jgi:hypothetical protein
MSGALFKYDAACRAVAEAKSFDDVKDIADKAAAVKEYARRANNRSLELDALEIRERARRRRGELLLELKAEGRLAKGPRKQPLDDGRSVLTLDDLDTSRDESARDQKLAKMDGNSFERLVARCRAYVTEHPEKHSFENIPVDGPVNGARSIMGSRQEPDDSLDYFPTPPWATRALIEYAFGALPECTMNSVWEPACGEGHIAEVLREFCSDVLATDIHPYGYSDRDPCNFLSPAADRHRGREWIISNPPFEDKALPFVTTALDRAKVGVAMFFRSQWAVEGIERYETIFRRRPPTLCAFFTERVNLCKGRWDPDGSTATAYCWLIWVKDAYPRAPFWIPPGCRKALERPSDREVFTAQPVRKRSDPSKDERPVPPRPDFGPLPEIEIPEILQEART